MCACGLEFLKTIFKILHAPRRDFGSQGGGGGGGGGAGVQKIRGLDNILEVRRMSLYVCMS